MHKVLNHIHIPRCSGIFMRSHILPNLKAKKIPFFATNHAIMSEKKFTDALFISGHFGKTPIKYNNNMINISVFRDPVDRYISNFLYINKFVDESDIWKKLDIWLYDENVIKYQSNLQSKNLTKYTDEEWYNKSISYDLERADNGWCLEMSPLNVKEAKDMVDSLDLFGTFDNYYSFINKYDDLVESLYGFRSFSNKNLINNNVIKINVPESKRKLIAEINNIDMELYDYVKSYR